MSDAQLTWESFRASVLKAGEDRMHLVSKSPLAAVFADQGGARVGLLIESANDTRALDGLDLLRIETEFVAHNGKSCLRATCSERRFFREAYLIFCAVADNVINRGMLPPQALVEEVQILAEILKEHERLSLDRQVGLFGELVVLKSLIKHFGAHSVLAWTGPGKEPHDFRLGDLELEVKTSRGTRRIHMVNGLHQTVPSHGFRLEFVSVLLAPADVATGMSLQGLIEEIAAMLAQTPYERVFESKLKDSDCERGDAGKYGARWTLRGDVVAIPLNEAFPSITKSMLMAGMGGSYSRLGKVGYEINLDGLGTPWVAAACPQPRNTNLGEDSK
jgi:hypothetical protein